MTAIHWHRLELGFVYRPDYHNLGQYREYFTAWDQLVIQFVMTPGEHVFAIKLIRERTGVRLVSSGISVESELLLQESQLDRVYDYIACFTPEGLAADEARWQANKHVQPCRSAVPYAAQCVKQYYEPHIRNHLSDSFRHSQPNWHLYPSNFVNLLERIIIDMALGQLQWLPITDGTIKIKVSRLKLFLLPDIVNITLIIAGQEYEATIGAIHAPATVKCRETGQIFVPRPTIVAEPLRPKFVYPTAPTVIPVEPLEIPPTWIDVPRTLRTRVERPITLRHRQTKSK